MNTNTVNPQARLHTGPPSGTGSRRTALRRPARDSVVAGVAAGLARYLGVDVMIIRLAFVVLAIVGGAGIPLYLAGLLLIPEEGSDQSIAGSLLESLRSRSR
jgi:phage shock protein PspC (stress-responsive transcriptional regulator)